MTNVINLRETDFNSISKTHDWRNYVPDEWRNTWDDFTDREQLIIYKLCEIQAEAEEWD